MLANMCCLIDFNLILEEKQDTPDKKREYRLPNFASTASTSDLWFNLPQLSRGQLTSKYRRTDVITSQHR